MKQPTITVSRSRKAALLFAPLLVLPLLTLGFWALGGGTGPEGRPGEQATGLNARLPSPRLDPEEGSKLSFYEVARGDSEKKRTLARHDAYLKQGHASDTTGTLLTNREPPLYFPQVPGDHDPEEAADKVYRRLSELQGQLSGREPQKKAAMPPPAAPRQGVDRSDMDRLEGMLHRLSGTSGRDPELEQLNGMMDKILDIQHPQRVAARETQEAAQNKERALAPLTRPATVTVSCLDTSGAAPSLGQSFYGIASSGPQDQEGGLPAVIHAGGVVRDGALVALRLLSDARIGGVLLPRNHLLYGTAALRSGRLQVWVSSVRYRDRLLAVHLDVYDKDGQLGLAVPGAGDRQAAQNALAGVTQSLGMATVDPSLRGQVAGAGTQALKSLLGKKVRQPRVQLPSGYRVLLYDRSNH